MVVVGVGVMFVVLWFVFVNVEIDWCFVFVI